jgi:CHAT domain-containing protein
MLRFQLSTFPVVSARSPALSGMLTETVKGHLYELYRMLVEPVRALLKGDHLVVVPHGLLHCLPFHALFDGRQYLIDSCTISYAPSARVYAFCQSRDDVPPNTSLIVGVDDPETPWISHEARHVAGVVENATLLLGPQATQAAVNELAPESGLVHIATHGVFRRDNPMFSSVRLADSHLSLYDLYKLPLQADLFALSGCGTGLNSIAAGDEGMGLARGLLYAGARSLLLTLWDVHDRSTALFMSCFYTELMRNRATKAAALRKAMLAIRDSSPHPYYWAPFMLVGRAP